MIREQRDSKRTPAIETREDGSKVIAGYAAVFYREGEPDTEYRLWEDAVERIKPGAFDSAIREGDDVRGMFDHTDLLGRSKSGTLRLSVDNVGLRYEIDPPANGIGPTVVDYLERGDVDGSSFAFSVRGNRGKVTWTEEVRDGKSVEVRNIEDVELFDVGPVIFPAYKATTAGVRSEDMDAIKAERAEMQREKEPEPVGQSVGQRLDIDLQLIAAKNILLD